MTLGYDGRQFLVAIDRLAREDADADEMVAIVLAGVQRARDSSAAAVQFGLLLDDEVSGSTASDAAADGLRVAVTVDDPAADGFALAHDDFGAHLESRAPDLAVVRLRWNPHDAPDVKKRTALELTKLGAWMHETERSLLVELDVPASSEDLDRVEGDAARYAAELRGERTRLAVQELRDLGLEADVWATTATRDPAEVAAFAGLVRDAGRDAVAALVVARDDDVDDVDDVLSAAGAGAPGVHGAIIGRPVWGAAVDGYRGGDLTRDEAVDRVARDLTHLVDVYTAAASA